MTTSQASFDLTESSRHEAGWAEQAEARILAAAIPQAERIGWTPRLVTHAARAAGLRPADAELLLPNGPLDLAALLWRHHDRVAGATLAATDPSSLKVRERIRVGAQTRVEMALADEAAVKAATRFLAGPQNARLALSLAWESADHIWRWAGDTSTDENHYSKRALLAAILMSTMSVGMIWGVDRARVHLTNRIDNIMAFESWKRRLPPALDRFQAVAGLLGRLRYGRP